MSKLGKLSDSVQSNHQLLAKTVLPQSQQFSNILSEFHKKQYQDFQYICSDLGRNIQNFKGKSDECQSNIHEIQTEWQKIKKFSNTGKGYLEAKSEEIKSKVKNIDAVSTGIKEAVSKIKPQKLAELPVEKSKPLQNMFKTLYTTLYHEKQSNFEWKNFRKLALKHQSGQDFLFRMVSINFKDLKIEEYQKLLMLKNDPQFDNLSVKTEHSFVIIDVADWIQYVCVGHQFSEGKKESEKEYEKIRKDMSKKSGGSLQISKKFWKEALQELNSYESNLENLEAELKTFKINAQNSLQTIQDGNQWRNEQITQINNLLA